MASAHPEITEASVTLPGRAIRGLSVVPAVVTRDKTTARGRNVSAGELLTAHLDELVRDLLRRDPDVREDRRDGVHRMRVTIRRLRSALATYRPILSVDRTEPLRHELRWLGAELGTPRDAEVLRDQVSAAIQSLPRDLRDGTVVRLLVEELHRRRRDAHAQLQAALDGARYSRLLNALEALTDGPPLNARAARSAAPEVDRLVRHTVRRVHRSASRAASTTEGVEREQALHDVRKDAKRSRYAAESAAPALGRRYRKMAQRMKDVQDLLGEVQDSVLIRRLMREIGADSRLVHEDGFTFGLLYGREEERSRRALEGYDGALRKALQLGGHDLASARGLGLQR